MDYAGTTPTPSRSASPSASVTWIPHPQLPEDQVPRIQRAIDRIPNAHLLPPQRDEVFDTPDDSIIRLQDYAFSQGFAVITSTCGQGRKNYNCIHHADKTRNYRKLPEHKEEEDLEHGTKRTQELTKIKAKGCPWRVYISWKTLKRGGTIQTWVLGVAQLEHSHGMSPNLLDYDLHQKRQPEHAQAILLARAHRAAEISYGQSDRVLSHTTREADVEYYMKKHDYYNLRPSATRSREDIITGLLLVLENGDFTAHKRFRKVQNENGVVVKRILEQIVIIDPIQKRMAKRFTSDFMIRNDATFSTNAEKLLLFVAVGVTNTNRSFPAAFSFATSESEENFNYFLLVLC